MKMYEVEITPEELEYLLGELKYEDEETDKVDDDEPIEIPEWVRKPVRSDENESIYRKFAKTMFKKWGF